jgi:hypothetical protein
VESRGAERIWKRQLRELFTEGQVIEEGNPLLIQIPDTEAIWWSQQPPERQVLRKRKRGVPCPDIPISATIHLGEDDDQEVSFITDTTGDTRLLDDIIWFPDLGESDSEPELSSNSDDDSVDSGEESS